MMRNLFISISCILCSWTCILFQSKTVHGDCFGERCGECLISGIHCFWCNKLNFTESRCNKENDHVLNGCTGYDIVRHSSSSLRVDKNEQLRDGNFVQQPILIQPQEITIKLVPNIPFKLELKYKVVKNFPVDIYFLVDPSYTMRYFRTQLTNLSTDIANAIEELTTDYRFGYGTSMDKVATPFTHTSEAYLQNPCPDDETQTCGPPHSFRHRLNFTSNVTEFKETVEATQQTANRDGTEGLFDGVMQAAVCTEAIGWRRNARRILMYASDSGYHFAGDGKLAGIVQKHDMKCHLAPFGNHMKYTHDTILDYPSVGQIRKVLSDNNINIIFAIGLNANRPTYRATNNYVTLNIPGSFTAELDTESLNLPSIIRDSYETLQGTVKIINDPFQNIDIDYRTTCNGREEYGSRNTCRNINVNVGEEILFEAWLTLKITKCPVLANDRIQRGSIYPEGLTDKLNLNIDYVCDCDCQSTPMAVDNATYCYGHGRLECGVCYCDNGFTGQFCATMITPIGCEQIFNGESVICGNIGSCNLDRCECPLGFSGQFCQCSNSSCGGYIRPGVFCNGNGLCECGECLCYPGFIGKTCGCSTSTENCTSTSSTNLCSGHGTCECGRCICDRDHKGELCEECPTCRPCAENKECAACVAFKNRLLSSEECKRRCQHVKVTSELDVNSSQCMYIASDSCLVTFTVESVGGGKFTVHVQKSKVCPDERLSDDSYLPLIISGSVVIGVCMILLVWKIITTLIDNKEYKKFENEIKAFEQLEVVTSASNPPAVHRINDHHPRRDSTESVVESALETNGNPGISDEHPLKPYLLSPTVYNDSNLAKGLESSRNDIVETNTNSNKNNTISQDEKKSDSGNMEDNSVSGTNESSKIIDNRKTHKLPPIAHAAVQPLYTDVEPEEKLEELFREKKKKKRKKKKERQKKRLLSQNVISPV